MICCWRLWNYFILWCLFYCVHFTDSIRHTSNCTPTFFSWQSVSCLRLYVSAYTHSFCWISLHTNKIKGQWRNKRKVPSRWHWDLCLLAHHPQAVMDAAEVLKSSAQNPFTITMHNFYHITTTNKTIKLNDTSLLFLHRVRHCISYDRFCPSDCLSHAGIMPKQLQLRSCGLHWRIAPWL